MSDTSKHAALLSLAAEASARFTPPTANTTPSPTIEYDDVPLARFIATPPASALHLDVHYQENIRLVYLRNNKQVGPLLTKMSAADVVKLFPMLDRSEVASAHASCK